MSRPWVSVPSEKGHSPSACQIGGSSGLPHDRAAPASIRVLRRDQRREQPRTRIGSSISAPSDRRRLRVKDHQRSLPRMRASRPRLAVAALSLVVIELASPVARIAQARIDHRIGDVDQRVERRRR